MSLTEKKEIYKIHGFKIIVTANFLVNKIKLDMIEPIQETVYMSMDKYIDFNGNMKDFVSSYLNVNHKLYKP